MLGKIVFDNDVPFYDPNDDNLVARVSTRQVLEQGTGDITIALIDCGAKRNIARCLLARNVRVITVPWDYDLFAPTTDFAFDGIVISNGPGNPKIATKTISTIHTALERRIPIFGICLGHQLLALAAGGDTYKLKFGHRSQNQPCMLHEMKRCFITTQNHGFAVGTGVVGRWCGGGSGETPRPWRCRRISRPGSSMPTMAAMRASSISSIPFTRYSFIQRPCRVQRIPSGFSTTFSRR